MRRRRSPSCDYKDDKECNKDYNCTYDYDEKECRRKGSPDMNKQDVRDEILDYKSGLPLSSIINIRSFAYDSKDLIDNYPHNPRVILGLLKTATDEEIIAFLTFLPDDVDYEFVMHIYNNLNPDKIPHYIGMSGNFDLLDIVRYNYGINTTEYSDIISAAARRGHIDMVRKVIKSISQNELRTMIDDAMSSAIEGGHIDIVHLLLDRTTNYDNAMRSAAAEGHMDIVLLLLKQGTTDYNWNWAMAHAAHGGHMDIVRLMLQQGADNYNWAMVEAAEEGHIDIVRLMLQLGAYDYENAMIKAVEEGHIDIVRLMLQLGEDDEMDYQHAMERAAEGGHIDIVRLMIIQHGDDMDFEDAIELADEEGYMDIVDLLESFSM